MSESDLEFDDELRHSMERVPAPAGFVDAVIERTRAEPRLTVCAAKPRKNSAPAGWPSLLLLAASLVVACGSALEVQHQAAVHRQQQAQRVSVEFDQAMSVTARTLEHIDENVSQAVTLSARKL